MSRRSDRDELVAEMGPIPKWWRPFARRRWKQDRAALLAIDVSEAASIYAIIYAAESVVPRPHPTLSLLGKDKPR